MPISFEFPLGGIYENSLSSPVILPLFHLASLSSIPLHFSMHWVGQSFKVFTLPCGKKGIKAQKVKERWKKMKP
jgi:hypothetical protein